MTIMAITLALGALGWWVGWAFRRPVTTHATHMTNHPRYSRAYRDRLRGGPPRVPAPCGTRAAAARHRRRGEPLDAACVDAERTYQREIARRRRKGAT